VIIFIFFLPGTISLLVGFPTFINSTQHGDMILGLFGLLFIALGGVLLLTAFISFIVFLSQKCRNKQNQQQLSSEENVPEKQENE